MILEAIFENRKERLLFGLSLLSDAMKDPKALTGVHDLEMIDMIDDVSAFVTGGRTEQAKDAQFDRLRDFLECMKGVDDKLHETLFATVIIRCATDMGIASRDDLERLRALVSAYHNVEVDNWITERLNNG